MKAIEDFRALFTGYIVYISPVLIARCIAFFVIVILAVVFYDV